MTVLDYGRISYMKTAVEIWNHPLQITRCIFLCTFLFFVVSIEDSVSNDFLTLAPEGEFQRLRVFLLSLGVSHIILVFFFFHFSFLPEGVPTVGFRPLPWASSRYEHG